MCNAALLESRGQSSTLAVEFAEAHGLVEIAYRCLLGHSLRRLEKHLKPTGKARGKLRGYVIGIVLEPGTRLVGCPGSRGLKRGIVYHYISPPLGMLVPGTTGVGFSVTVVTMVVMMTMVTVFRDG